MSENATKKQGKSDNRGKHPNSRKNLEKGTWKQGESGNPKGMEVGTLHIKTRLLKMLENLAPDVAINGVAVTEFAKGLEKPTNFDALNAVLLYNAIVERDLGAIKEIHERIEGKARQAMEITGADGEDLFKHITVRIIDGNSDRHE